VKFRFPNLKNISTKKEFP